MKIETIKIKNFRSFSEETITFDNYTCLVGPNGGGKSTVLSALNVFFRETANASTDVTVLNEEDFYKKDTSKPVEITVTFKDLSPAAQEDFKEYYRQDRLIISVFASYDAVKGRAEVMQRGKRLVMRAFAKFFKAKGDGAKVADLAAIYEEIRKDVKDLPECKVGTEMMRILREYETSHPELLEELWSSDQFYGVSKGANRLEKYIQWIYVPAVKNIASEQSESKTSALGKLLARTVRLKVKFDDELQALQTEAENDYLKILKTHEPELEELGKILQEKLAIWAHPAVTLKMSWQKNWRDSVKIEDPAAHAVPGEGVFEGDMARMGNGLQRSYLLALLEVLATLGDSDPPTLLLGCEEPELYQHPPQARHMASVLEQLSERNAQVIVTSHSPAFINGKGFESVRMVRFDRLKESSSAKRLLFEDVATRIGTLTGEKPIQPAGMGAKLHQLLQPGMNEIFFGNNLVLVEGLEDVAIISSWMMLTGQFEECRRKGINIVPVNGKSFLVQALAVAQGLGIPVFTIFDADGNTANPAHRPKHEKDNKTLLGLLGGDVSQPFPAEALWATDHIVWTNNITDMLEQEIGAAKYATYCNQADTLYGQPGGMEKNTLCIGSRLQFAFDDGTRPASLDRMCKAILDAAK